jgi:uncharacterized protein
VAQNKDITPVNPQMLLELVTVRMPFGKHKGRILCDLPEHYLSWFNRKGFPQGKLGVLLSALYEIKLNGLEYLLKPIRKNQP